MNTDPNLLNTDPNLSVYNAPGVAEYYAGLTYLTPCERLLFDAYLKPGMAILDLGVGGGRTATDLSSIAGKYVGVDYAPEMIAACRRKFPQLDFEVGNASDLSRFGSANFDAVVMAFNGIDYLPTDEARACALREIHRVLKLNGILIFSSHNPRSILVRPSWNRQRLLEFAQKLVGVRFAASPLLLEAFKVLRGALAGAQSGWLSLARFTRRVPTAAFWRGHGYSMDSAHGGLRTHRAIPKQVVREVNSSGFRILRIVGDDYPRQSNRFITDWFYYVFSKTVAPGEK
ncbi:MAG: class I SAM-dependent methyltransferase [Candidatus Sulfotelmatobacter sp.]